jgi:hypothetical protein
VVVKQPQHEADHSLPPSAAVKNAWSYTFNPPYIYMAWCLGTGPTLPSSLKNTTFGHTENVTTQT